MNNHIFVRFQFELQLCHFFDVMKMILSSSIYDRNRFNFFQIVSHANPVILSPLWMVFSSSEVKPPEARCIETACLALFGQILGKCGFRGGKMKHREVPYLEGQN